METFPVDMDADEVVRWIIAEHEAAPESLRIAARRTNEVRDLPARKEFHLGDQEREELSEVATVATLEVSPAHADDGWLLTVGVEDEVGPRLPEKGVAAEDEQGIDIATFYREFIRSGRGVANVVAQVDGPDAEARMTSLLDAIANDRHPGAARSRA